jgi:hypothetical protein
LPEWFAVIVAVFCCSQARSRTSPDLGYVITEP